MDDAATRWYGGPAVAADVAEVALLYAMSRDHSPGATKAAELLLLSTLVSGAVVHGLHGHPGRAAGSVALRLGAMLTSASMLLWLINCSGAEDMPCQSSFAGSAPALIIGLPLAAMAIDDAFLAREAVPSAAPAKTSWTPTLRIQSGLAMLGMGASF
jgi:hypothetical protein